jgi:hypothetical protein
MDRDLRDELVRTLQQEVRERYDEPHERCYLEYLSKLDELREAMHRELFETFLSFRTDEELQDGIERYREELSLPEDHEVWQQHREHLMEGLPDKEPNPRRIAE